MKTIYTLTIILFLTCTAHADITLSWVAPDTNEDGSELRDLAGYIVAVIVPYVCGEEICYYPFFKDIEDPEATEVTFPLTGYLIFAVLAYDDARNASTWSELVVHDGG